MLQHALARGFFEAEYLYVLLKGKVSKNTIERKDFVQRNGVQLSRGQVDSEGSDEGCVTRGKLYDKDCEGVIVCE